MIKNRLKLFIWLGLSGAAVVAIIATIVALGRVVVFFNTGADRESALNIVPAVPSDLAERVTWLPDHPDAAEGRRLDPVTRDRIAGAYIEGWAQVNISHELGRPYGLKTYFSGQALDQVTATVEDASSQEWEHLQSNLHHLLQLKFYSDDGSIAAVADHNAEFVRYLRKPEAEAGVVVESNTVYDMVMLLEDGNWRVRFLVRRGDAGTLDSRLMERLLLTRTLTMTGAAGISSTVGLTTPVLMSPASPITATASLASALELPPTRFTVDDRRLLENGEPFTVHGVNYYPRATPWTLFWSEYDPQRTAQDLDVVRLLGLNTVRIFVPFDEFGAGKEVAPDNLASLLDFLDQAAAKKVAVVVTLFDHRTDHRPANWAADKRHLAELIPPLAGHPAILAWDVKNEPDRDYEFNSPELTQAWLRYVIRQVRLQDPGHLITIGWSTPEAAVALAEDVDIVSYHYFAPVEEYDARVADLQRAIDYKPVLLEEFGLPTWNSIFPHGHTEEEQALYYAELLQGHRKLNTAGFLAWTLYDFTTVALGEFLMPWQSGPQAHMGLIRTDYTFKPAAALVEPGATLAAKAIPEWQRFTKPFWLMIFACFALFGVLVLLLLIIWLRRRHRMGRFFQENDHF